MTLVSLRRLASALLSLFTLAAPLVPAQSSIQLGGRGADPNNAGISGTTVILIARDDRLRTTAMTARLDFGSNK